ncbi:MAG: hypothetical protein U1F57_02950 [bacterium]
MRKVIFLCLLAAFSAAGCSRKATDENVTAKVAEALCAKMKECSPQAAMPGDTCTNMLKVSLLKPLQAHGKSGKVTEKELNACVTEVKGFNCQTFSGLTNPVACSFFKE